MLKLFSGVRPLRWAGAVRDAAAGVAFAAINIPQALGYTRIAGMPVVTGLYSLLLPLLAFATFGSSRFLVVAADSATAAILHSGLDDMATPASARYVALAGMVALLTAGFLLLGRLLQLGFIADFLSQTVLIGFLTGVGIQVGTAVLGQMLGVRVASRHTVLQLYEVCRELPKVHLPTLAVAVAVIVWVLVLRWVSPKIPGPMIAVIGATAASAVWHFAGHGIAVIGPIEGGLPRPAFPMVTWKDLVPLLEVAGSCAVMIVTQSAATSRIYAARHQQKLDANDDLLGLAAANAAAAMSGSFVVNGSPTQTAIIESAGSGSQVAQITAAVLVALVLLFATKPLEYLPQSVLGALVFLVAVRLIDFKGMLGFRKESPGEFTLAVATTVMVVLAGVEQGIVLAMTMSLLRIVYHSYHPRTGVMVREADGTWTLLPPVLGNVTEPGLVMYRFGATLFYANANRFSDEILGLIGPVPSAIRCVIVDAEAMTNVDYSAARVLIELKKNLDAAGVRMGFARVSLTAQSDFDRHHVTEAVGREYIFTKLHKALADCGRPADGAASAMVVTHDGD